MRSVMTVLDRILNKKDAEAVNELTSWLIFLKWFEYQQDLSDPERYVIAIHDLIREALNGGFHQFFHNSSGQWANDVLPALQAIDDKQVYPIYREVLALYFANGRVPEDSDERSELIEIATEHPTFVEREDALHERFNSLFKSQAWYEDLVNRVVGFISKNREAFNFGESVYSRWLNPELAKTFPGDATYRVDLRDELLRITEPDGAQKLISCSSLVEIAIVRHGKSRTGLFPWEGPTCPYSGYSWRFKSADTACAVPFHAQFDQEFVKQLFALDGFEPTCLIEQERYMLCPTGTEWICWVQPRF
jgi:hypothetical protein